MSDVKYALKRFEDKDTTKIITHVIPISIIKKVETVAGKKKYISYNPQNKSDFSRTQWYQAFKRMCPVECTVDHDHGKYEKAKILHLGGKYLLSIFNIIYQYLFSLL